MRLNTKQHDLVVIDWEAALPRRPGQPSRITRQPIAQCQTAAKPERLWPATPQETRPQEWANAAWSYTLKLATAGVLSIIAIVAIITAIAFYQGFTSAFEENETCSSKSGPCGPSADTAKSTSAPIKSSPSTTSPRSTY